MTLRYAPTKPTPTMPPNPTPGQYWHYTIWDLAAEEHREVKDVCAEAKIAYQTWLRWGRPVEAQVVRSPHIATVEALLKVLGKRLVIKDSPCP